MPRTQKPDNDSTATSQNADVVLMQIPVVPGRRAEVSGGKGLTSQRKNLPTECTQRLVRFPSQILLCSDVPHGGDLMRCGMMWYDVV